MISIALDKQLAPNLSAAIALPRDGSDGRLTIFTKDHAPIDDELRSRLYVTWLNDNGSPGVPLWGGGVDTEKPYVRFPLAMTNGTPAIGSYEISLDYPGTKLGEVRIGGGLTVASDPPPGPTLGN